jgi:hypothetical protein
MFKEKKNYTSGFVLRDVLISMLAVFVVAIVVALIAVHGSKISSNFGRPSEGDTSVASTASGSEVLPPATVSPKVGECTQTITYDSNGSPTPLQCANGDINTSAWKALSALEPTVMSLGYAATQTQVQTAMCNDANAADEDSSASLSTALETSAYNLSSVYYGWSYGSAPISVLSGSGC